jgi:hypothetical protein
MLLPLGFWVPLFVQLKTAVEEYQIFSKDFCLNIFVRTNLFLPTSKREAKNPMKT